MESKSPDTQEKKTADDVKKGPSVKRFLPNSQYFTISIYVLIVVAVSALIIRVVMTPHAVSGAISDILNVLMPFLIGILIAFVLNPVIRRMVRFLHRRCRISSLKVCKALSIAVSYLLVIGLFVLCIVYIVPQIVISLTEVINGLPRLSQMISDFLDTMQERFPNADVSDIQKTLNDIFPDIISYLKNFASDLVPAIYSASISIVTWIVNIIIALIMSAYMLTDKKSLQHSLRKIIYSFVPIKRIGKTMEILTECHHIFTNFIVGQAIDSLVVGTLCFTMMSILRLPYALLISVVVCITNMIPYFGPLIGAVPGILSILLVSPWKALAFAVMIFSLQQIDGWFICPRILGNTVGMKPLWVIVSITLGGNIGGMLGMFLSVPVAAVLKYLLTLYLDYRLEKRGIAGSDIP